MHTERDHLLVVAQRAGQAEGVSPLQQMNRLLVQLDVFGQERMAGANEYQQQPGGGFHTLAQSRRIHP
ncbi:MAG: hypothetical protein H0X25_06560 [Acidobacteriales bacterium]|nr:hypothetical protein [Terriglobales bacterium]